MDPLLLKHVTQLDHDPEVLRQSQRDPRGGCDLWYVCSPNKSRIPLGILRFRHSASGITKNVFLSAPCRESCHEKTDFTKTKLTQRDSALIRLTGTMETTALEQIPLGRLQSLWNLCQLGNVMQGQDSENDRHKPASKDRSGGQVRNTLSLGHNAARSPS